MRISDWSSDVCSSDLGVGRQQRLMREPYFARTEAAARQRQHRMMREAQRIFDGLALIGHAIQQDLEAHEMPIADAVILDLDPHDRRSEERRGGTEGVITCSSRWSPYH